MGRICSPDKPVIRDSKETLWNAVKYDVDGRLVADGDLRDFQMRSSLTPLSQNVNKAPMAAMPLLGHLDGPPTPFQRQTRPFVPKPPNFYERVDVNVLKRELAADDAKTAQVVEAIERVETALRDLKLAMR